MASRSDVPGTTFAERAVRGAFSRAVNDDLMQLAVAHAGLKQIVCECSKLECAELLEVTAGDYAAVRAHAARFLVAGGHELEDVQQVLTRSGRVAVIQERDELVHPHRPAASTRAGANGKPPRVLIVDDDPAVRELCATSLRVEGLMVLEAPDGRRGLERARAERPNLVLTDVMMPGLDGFQLAGALRRDERTRGIPFIFLSGETDAADALRAYELGALAYVTKPFDPSALASVVARVIQRLPHRVAKE